MMPASAAGSAVMMMNGIEPRLEVHDDQEIDEDDREGEPAEEADVRRAHGLDLPAQVTKLPRGRCGRLASTMRVMSRPTAPRSRSCTEP
jgi:hypothetical protein